MDGSTNGRESSIGGLATDSNNKLILAYEYMGDITILKTELQAMWSDLFFAKQNNWYNVWIEIDCKIVALLDNGNKDSPWNY